MGIKFRADTIRHRETEAQLRFLDAADERLSSPTKLQHAQKSQQRKDD